MPPPRWRPARGQRRDQYPYFDQPLSASANWRIRAASSRACIPRIPRTQELERPHPRGQSCTSGSAATHRRRGRTCSHWFAPAASDPCSTPMPIDHFTCRALTKRNRSSNWGDGASVAHGLERQLPIVVGGRLPPDKQPAGRMVKEHARNCLGRHRFLSYTSWPPRILLQSMRPWAGGPIDPL
jgi:hypothetical protein